jgi:hypothetical protein
MGKALQNQEKPAQPKSETNALAPWKISITNRKRIPPIQSSTDTHLHLWHSAMGERLKFQHRNSPALSILNAPWYIHNRRFHEDLKMNTGLSEIKK